MNSLLSFLRSLGAARLGAMGAVAAILVGAFAFVILRFSQPVMVPLYTDLTLTDSAAIVRELESASVTYELRGDGGTVLVPAADVLPLRMRLAGEGLPSGGSVGYELFDKTNTLGATSFVQNINHLRALEGELARTIRTIDRISFARVHLVIPERQLFQRERADPSASIVLRVRGGLDTGQIRAIQHLAAAAVNGLTPSRVSIVDETGRLLASGDGDAVGIIGSNADERRQAVEKRLESQVTDIVASVVGIGRARVQVAADFDLSHVTRTQDTFDPNSQVVRSTQSRTDESSSTTADSGAVSVSTSLPEGQATSADPEREQALANNAEETVNYEISRTTTTEVLEAGRLRKLAVAVLVDGVYSRDAAGALQYAERSPEELERIAALVRTAVGFDAARGDKVEVVNLRFAEPPRLDEVETVDAGMGLGRADYFYIAELILAAVLGLIVIFFVIRPLIRRIVTPDGPVGTGIALIPAGEPGVPAAITDQRPATTPAPMPMLTREQAGETAAQIERAMQTGALHADTIKRVGGLIEQSPPEAAAIVRSWLADAA